MRKRRQLDLHSPVITLIPTQPVTWANWRQGMGPNAERFLEHLIISIRNFAETSMMTGGPTLSVVVNDSLTIAGILDVLTELCPHQQLRLNVAVQPNPNLLAPDDTVIGTLSNWSELPPFTRLYYLCLCYRALFTGRANIHNKSTHFITLDAVIGIAGLYGIAVDR